MSASLLVQLDEGRAFRPLLGYRELAWVHVPFDELVGEPRHETRVTRLGRTGANVAIVGDPGSGKSSISSWSLDPHDGVYGVPVPVAAYHRSGDVGANDVAALVLHAFALLLRDVEPGAAAVADRLSHASSGRRWAADAAIDLGPLHAGVREQLRDMPNRLEERVDAIHQTLAVFGSHDMAPVLVLDDTDKWVDRHGDPEPAVNGFFRDVVRWLAELPAALVVNVHSRYVQHVGAALDWFDERITVPRIGGRALVRVLDERVRAATADTAGVSDVFDEDALNALATWFDEGPDRAIRSAVRLVSSALTEALVAGKDRVDQAVVANALVDLA